MLIGWKPKSSSSSVASVRYRCLAPMVELQAKGFPVELFDENRARQYSLVVFSKLYSCHDQALASRLKAAGVKTALDVCDNHFYNPYELTEYTQFASDLKAMIGLVDFVVCSTVPLAEIVQREAGLPCTPFVVGDAIEPLPQVRKRPWSSWFRKRSTRPVLLWQGIHGVPNAPCGMLDLLKLEAVLAKLAKRFDFELVVVSNHEKKFREHICPLPFPTRYVTWSLKNLSRALNEASAVVIPVTNNPFTICKTNNRLALALASSVPVIADSIPSYEEFSEFCVLDSWEKGLEAVLTKSPALVEATVRGQKFVAAHYTITQIAAQWGAFFRAAHQLDDQSSVEVTQQAEIEPLMVP